MKLVVTILLLVLKLWYACRWWYEMYEGIIVAKVFSMRKLKSQMGNSKFEVVNIYFAYAH